MKSKRARPLLKPPVKTSCTRILIAKWQKLNEQYTQNASRGNGHACTQEAEIAELERLIGQQTVEISLLKKVALIQERLKAENGANR